jgi:hypothetical protein
MKMLDRIFTGLVILPIAFSYYGGEASAAQAVSQWYIGKWDCHNDGRIGNMEWLVVNDSQTACRSSVCKSSSGVKVVGKFKFDDDGGAWIPLVTRYIRGNELGIRDLGKGRDNWLLRYDPQSKVATGWMTWKNIRYPLECSLQGK